MKKLLFSFILVAGFVFTAPFVQNANADICVPSDPDYDLADCTANGGVSGTPIGIGGGPGGSGGVPIDGGLSIMLAVGGALGARKALRKKKANA
jgi:hypothetical protein